MSVKSDIWDSDVRHYWDALKKADPIYYVKVDHEDNEFDTWKEAKQFAKDNHVNRIKIDSFEFPTCRNACYPEDYDAYDKVIVDIDKNIISWGKN